MKIIYYMSLKSVCRKLWWHKI